MQRWLEVVAVATLCMATAAAELPAYRLPGDVIPQLYNLSIAVDLDKFEFSGDVDIQVECKKATEMIKLHSVSLVIPDKGVTLTRPADKKPVVVNSVQLDPENEFLMIKVDEKLQVGFKYNIRISGFAGNLTEGLSGFYRSQYEDKSTNSTMWVAVTQFEATDARRAFPCFDEPNLKARFLIRLAHNAKFGAISNMPMTASRPHEFKNGWIWSEFQETVPMSTYLVAFLISDFDFRQSNTESNNVEFRVWARREAIDQVDFAKEYGPKFLNYYERFFNVSYPLPKQDMVALPDFAAGAMENWGLITYRESMVLSDKNVTSESTKYDIANTIAHELAHQWFGNLVTMKWWTDLWLNEGFATFVAGMALHHQFPSWNAYNYEVAASLIDVFNLDSLKSSHPVSVTISHPSEIDQIFDSISYSKGSLLIHMMKSYLGGEVFLKGVSDYIKKFAYGNSEQDDLWDCLTIAAHEAKVLPNGLSVKEIMDTWTLQTGYPVLTVRRNKGTLTISQKRFFLNQLKREKSVNGSWWVPLTYSTAKHPNFHETRTSLWLSPKLDEISIDTKAGEDDWILLNNKAAAIYRVNYDTHTWSLLVKMLHAEDLSRVDELSRTTLVLDAMALAQTGTLPYATAIQVLKYARREFSFNPWQAITTCFDDLEALLMRTEQFPKFKSLVQSLLSNVYDTFSDLMEVPQGLEPARFKALIVSYACHFGMDDCVLKARQLFNYWMSSSKTNPIPKDLRNTVYCQGVREGDNLQWTFVWQQYMASNLASEKNGFLKALSCTRQEHLINRYLEWSIDPSSGIRRQDADLVFTYVAMESPSSFLLSWRFLEKNINKIYDYLQPNTKDLGSYIKVLTSRMVFPEEVEKFKTFLKTHEKLLEKSQLLVKQGLETAETNLAWMNRFYTNISIALGA